MKVKALHTMRLGFDEVFVSGNVYEVVRARIPVEGKSKNVLKATNELGKMHVIADNWKGYGDDFFDKNFEIFVKDEDIKLS